jgi:excisionase family DNA binding protein
MTILQLEKTDLQEMFKDCIRQVINEVKPSKSECLPDSISLTEACAIIGTKEKPASKATVYKLTMDKEVPFSKFGKRLVFSRKQLMEWMESRTICASSTDDSVSERLTSTARKRLSK